MSYNLSLNIFNCFLWHYSKLFLYNLKLAQRIGTSKITPKIIQISNYFRFPPAKILFYNVKILASCIKILFYSLKILFYSLKILFNCIKILFYSLKILFYSMLYLEFNKVFINSRLSYITMDIKI